MRAIIGKNPISDMFQVKTLFFSDQSKVSDLAIDTDLGDFIEELFNSNKSGFVL